MIGLHKRVALVCTDAHAERGNSLSTCRLSLSRSLLTSQSHSKHSECSSIRIQCLCVLSVCLWILSCLMEPLYSRATPLQGNSIPDNSMAIPHCASQPASHQISHKLWFCSTFIGGSYWQSRTLIGGRRSQLQY